jgi:phage major head subunit gpT-like protein
MSFITQANLDALRIVFSKGFEKAYGEAPSWWAELATKVPSSTASNRYGWVAQMVKLREWLGPRVALNLSEHEYTIRNRKFEGTREVDRDQIEDDNLGMYQSILIPQLAQAVKKHPDQLLKTLLQSSTLAFDGLSLFNDAHLTFNGSGTYDNKFAGTALSLTNFGVVWAAMAGYTGEDGEPLGVMPDLLIVPPQLKKTALEIVNATLIATGGTNVLQGWARVLVVPELANQPTVWYLADTSKGIKPFVWQVRRSPEFVSRDNLSDPKVFEQEKFTYGVNYRGEVGITLPFLISQSTA